MIFARDLKQAPRLTGMPAGHWWTTSGSRITVVTCPKCGRGQTVDPSATGSVDFKCPYVRCGFRSELHLKGWS